MSADLRFKTRHSRCFSRTVAKLGLLALTALARPARALSTPTAAPTCEIDSTTLEGWHAQQIVNHWVKLVIVPQLGGRVMQVTFAGHPYLFVNPRFKGKYFPPSEGAAKGLWFNYGGDKIWPLPEGTQDEQHWPGPLSDALDDGEYAFSTISQGAACTVRLDGPPDPRTGLQYSREITLMSEAPKILFHARMKNIAGHPIEWSMQSVTQYDTQDVQNSDSYNHDFWAFTPVNPRSAYAGQYRVRSGLSNDPSFSVKDGLFTLHWIDLQNEVWIDSPGDWVAVVDRSARYAMVERFTYTKTAEYPGSASVIFYKNGPPPERKKSKGEPLSPSDPDDSLFYMEAELNSSMVRLEPGASYAMDTQWFPAILDSTGAFKTVSDAGVIGHALQATSTETGILLTGSFGVFFPGSLIAHVYDNAGLEASPISLQTVDPADPVELHCEIKPSRTAARVSLHLIDRQGTDRGSLGEVQVTRKEGSA